MNMDALKIIGKFYPEDMPLRRILLKHSTQVRDLALEFAQTPESLRLELDLEVISNGAMLHDIGIHFCDARGILCEGTEPYITHGILGAKMLRELGPEYEPYARICERHTGAGLTAEEIQKQALPLPPKDFLPETPEEKLICLADKFFSKSGTMERKSFAKARHSMEKFGPPTLARFDALCAMFGIFSRDSR